MTSDGRHQSRKSFINKTCLESRIRETEPLLDEFDNNDGVSGVSKILWNTRRKTRDTFVHILHRVSVSHTVAQRRKMFLLAVCILPLVIPVLLASGVDAFSLPRCRQVAEVGLRGKASRHGHP